MAGIHEKYMRRALEIARKGLPYAMPNPMVGAVIVAPDGKIIGEGYHRRCGEGHAEVNAVADYERRYGHDSAYPLSQATMYVTLEPCAHYGRTGPCAKLIIDKHIPRVVVGTRDPFDKVDGKGIEMLREAGVEVATDVLAHDCRSLNAIFFTAHTQKRPFVILKWAQSADGYIDRLRTAEEDATKISSPLTSVLSHQLRAVCDAILVGSGTVISDNPGLDTRLWPGTTPRPVVLDRRHRITSGYKVLERDPIIISEDMSIADMLRHLYDEHKITSLLVEGGAKVLDAFIRSGVWDLARVEISQQKLCEGVTAPQIGKEPIKVSQFERQIVKYYSENPLVDVKNL